MKKIIKLLTFLAVLFVIGYAAVTYFTNNLITTTDRFFTAIKNNDYNGANQYLSQNFKQSTPLSQLKQALPYSRFRNYETCSFSTKVVNIDGTGKLEGRIVFTDGSAIPIKISFVKEKQGWKIDHIYLPKSGLSQNKGEDYSNPTINQANYTILVKETMQKLGKAIATGYYNDFYSYTAPQFRQSVPLEKIESAFSRFQKVPINWETVGNLEPAIQSKQLQENGVLKLIGFFPSNPYKVGFDFEYFKNNDKWKVVGVFLKLE
ncbi:conserved hypothetical protein [Thermosulfidibacter takaii ABI70S6]|uniref:DUF4878 domain-containing protein n=1 Tax=Thermosulfidibacter takaii (strain DSM 17441 / JCM 13301 / NBRC 103674 / ABI70S6) TaxID=1298851 RepID=A0A0S3QUQ5_THET7|nr:hypothetical protein [Thermosulfidibacter takaii]BAT72043.1 conserved hypothetical protein [Thermosulfidibacter takaii ABI70S6]